mgnify:CR=1 FL=1
MTGLMGWSQYKRYKLAKETQLKNEILKQQELATKAVIEAEGEQERHRHCPRSSRWSRANDGSAAKNESLSF